jgi:hypothetical protein
VLRKALGVSRQARWGVSREARAGLYSTTSAGGNEAMSYEAPYQGVKVIDLSQGVAGPYCAMLLAQYGANVIKVEPTDTGDWARGLGRVYGDHTAYSIPTNIGKRSISKGMMERRSCGASSRTPTSSCKDFVRA